MVETMADPASHAGAAVRGWDHPVSREHLMLMDLYDRFIEANTVKGKPKPYPRPWRTSTSKVARSSLTREETLAALRYAGHTNLPDD